VTVEISSTLLAAIHAAAAAAHPLEACGLLLGRTGRIEAAPAARNVAADPARRFELDPAAHFAALRAARAGGPALLGHWHSHPAGPAAPSATDAAMALEPGRLWLILGGGEARLWQVAEAHRFAERPLHVRPR